MGRSKFGLHVHLDYDAFWTRKVIETGKIRCLTVINDVDLANWAVQYVPYVVFRMVWTDHDPHPPAPRGDYADPGARAFDENLGREWFYDGIDSGRNMWWWNRQTKPEVILQVTNEWNAWNDSHFEIGVMKAAQAERRKMAIKNDAVGNPADSVVNGQRVRPLWFDAQGNPHSDIVPGTNLTLWQHVVPCINHAAINGHYFGVHVYGNIEVGRFAPLSDPLGYPYYGGRPHEFWRMTPAPRPKMLITEAGPGKAEEQQNNGFDAMWRDATAYDQAMQLLPDVAGFMWWTDGSRNPNLGFPGASISQWLPLIHAKLLVS